ncbi:hypothetical protein FD754_006258 [Muntiacus muntjak]|uniref:Calbindin n=1 Tax=Muntiacus muntjak TaxID=9888 RepID=A0A5N3WJX4_MUNMU|nr:hypothetical protein FD754_006258 [Muntiacus muntjak]
MWETGVRSLGWEDPLEKEMATSSSILAWRIPWTEDPVKGHIQHKEAELSPPTSEFIFGLVSSLLRICLPTQETQEMWVRYLDREDPLEEAMATHPSKKVSFLENNENFLKDLLEKANKTVDDTKLAEYTDLMLKLFDSNNDGKLELTEMARLLPVQENFLLKFQGVKMCGKEFNKAFELYDQDGNGYIDENELDALLKDLCEKNKQDLDINNIPTYKKSIMALSDGGKLYRTDLALILSAGDN